MGLTVDQLDRHVHHRVASKHTVLQSLFYVLAARGEELPGDDTPDGMILDKVTLTSFARDDLYGHLGELPAAARLLDLLALAGSDTSDGLAVGDARLTGGCFDAMVKRELFPDDLQVQLARARDERLARLGVCADVEGRVAGNA